MWTSTYRLRPVTRCKEGCRCQPPGQPGGFAVVNGRFLPGGYRLRSVA